MIISLSISFILFLWGLSAALPPTRFPNQYLKKWLNPKLLRFPIISKTLRPTIVQLTYSLFLIKGKGKFYYKYPEWLCDTTNCCFFSFYLRCLVFGGWKRIYMWGSSIYLVCEESKTSFDGIFQKYFHLFFTHTLLSRPFLFRLFGFFVPYIMFCFFVCILCAWHNLILDRGVSTCDFILSASISTSYQCFLNIQTLWQVLVFSTGTIFQTF